MIFKRGDSNVSNSLRAISGVLMQLFGSHSIPKIKSYRSACSNTLSVEIKRSSQASGFWLSSCHAHMLFVFLLPVQRVTNSQFNSRLASATEANRLHPSSLSSIDG